MFVGFFIGLSDQLILIILSLIYSPWHMVFIKVISFDTKDGGVHRIYILWLFYRHKRNHTRKSFSWWKLKASVISLGFLSFLTISKRVLQRVYNNKKESRASLWPSNFSKGFIGRNNSTVVPKNNFVKTI